MEQIILNSIVFYKTSYKGYYVSHCGKIASVRSKGYFKTGIELDYSRPTLLKYKTDRDGYFEVCFSINKERYCKKVHQVVAETFIPKPSNDLVVDHIDCNRQNNNRDNLRWLTSSENVKRRSDYKSSLWLNVNVTFEGKTFKFRNLRELNDHFSGLRTQIQKMRTDKTYTTKRAKYKILSFIEGEETIEIECIETLKKVE